MTKVSFLCVGDAPVPGSVHIPFAELPSRVHELPDRLEPLVLVGDVPVGTESWLEHRGYEVTQSLVVSPIIGAARLWSPVPIVERLASVYDVRGLEVYEPGCGSGRNAVFLAELGANVTACDVLPDAIERATDLQTRYAQVHSMLEPGA